MRATVYTARVLSALVRQCRPWKLARGIVSAPSAATLTVLLAVATTALAQPQGPPPSPYDAPDVQYEGQIIADVRPRSMTNPTVTPDKIMNMLKTRPGKPYSQATLLEDYRKLFETGSFRDIRYSLEPSRAADGTPDGKIVVNLFLYEHPSVIREIKYQGRKHISEKDLNEATGLRKGMPMSPVKNREACQKIMEVYHEKGRMLARVILTEGSKPDDNNVIFNITEGPKAKVKAIEFTGNSFVSGQRLATQIHSGHEWLGLLGGTYHADMVDEDIRELKKYYQTFGFHDVQVSPEVVWEPDQIHITLIFHVHEGPRYKIASVTLSGNKAYREEELLRLVKAKPGEDFSGAAIKSDIESIQDYEGYRGHGTQVHEQLYFPVDRPGEVDVHYELMERPPAKFGQIIIYGNDVTRQNVILRQIPVYPGQVLSYPDLRLGEKNLAKLGIFKADQDTHPTITVLDPDSDSEYKDVLVTVEETQTGSLIFGLGVNSNSGLNGSIVLNERNFDITNWPTSWAELTSGKAWRGAGQEFRIQAMPGTVMQQYSASFREPYLFDTQWSFGASLYYFQRFYLEYQENRIGTSFSLGRQLTPTWSVNGTIRIEDVGIRNVPVYAPADFQNVEGGSNFLVGFKGAIKRDTRNSFLRATEGSTIEASFEQVVGDFYFPSATIEGNKYFTIYKRPDNSGAHVLALRSMAGIVGSQTPVFERLYAGGFRTIRGFQFRGVGPNTLGFMTGGDFMFLNSAEYQIPLRANDQIYLVGFCDSGTVENSVEIRDYRVTVGTGVRFTVPMMGPMPIALDFGFPVMKASTDRTQVFSFWVGFMH